MKKSSLLQNVFENLPVRGGGVLIPFWLAVTLCPKEKSVYHGGEGMSTYMEVDRKLKGGGS